MTLTMFILTFVVFSLAIVGLAVGSLIKGQHLKGSCGGLSAVPGLEEQECGCKTPCEKKQKALKTQEKIIQQP